MPCSVRDALLLTSSSVRDHRSSSSRSISHSCVESCAPISPRSGSRWVKHAARMSSANAGGSTWRQSSLAEDDTFFIWTFVCAILSSRRNEAPLHQTSCANVPPVGSCCVVLQTCRAQHDNSEKASVLGMRHHTALLRTTGEFAIKAARRMHHPHLLPRDHARCQKYTLSLRCIAGELQQQPYCVTCNRRVEAERM